MGFEKRKAIKDECDCGGLISWDEDDFYGICKKCNQVYQRGREVE